MSALATAALRYGAGTSVLVLTVCAIIAGLSTWTLVTVGSRLAAGTARTDGEVVRTAEGSTELAAMDRAASGLAYSGLTATVVLGTAGWQLVSRRRLRTRAGQPYQVRRVRVQSGLLVRSWLELEWPPRWIPVHFDPILVRLTGPTVVQLHGDPQRDRLVAVEHDGRWLYPSGPNRSHEPRGRRISDSSSSGMLEPYGWRRQLRADAGLLTIAPVVGLLWVFLDGGGLITWVTASVLTAALALWWAALRGSDPS